MIFFFSNKEIFILHFLFFETWKVLGDDIVGDFSLYITSRFCL